MHVYTLLFAHTSYIPGDAAHLEPAAVCGRGCNRITMCVYIPGDAAHLRHRAEARGQRVGRAQVRAVGAATAAAGECMYY